jgi:hypothetical protein
MAWFYILFADLFEIAWPFVLKWSAPISCCHHALDKTVLTLSAHTEPGHAFLKQIGAAEKHRTVENRAVFAELDWPRSLLPDRRGRRTDRILMEHREEEIA